MAEPQPRGGAEQILLDAARRAARQAAPSRVLVLHLSAMLPPAPRPHHGRIARAMLHEAAQLHEGQVLSLAGGDLVLLCADRDAATAVPPARGHAPVLDELPALLMRLLGADALDGQLLVSLWRLPQMASELLAYATARANAPRPTDPAERSPPRAMSARNAGETGEGVIERSAETAQIDALVKALEAAVDAADIGELLHRQTAIVLPPQSASGGRLQPLFRELSFSVTALEARTSGRSSARADPYLHRYLAARLDRRMLDALAAAPGHLEPLHGVGTGGLPLFVNLSLAAILSPAFARFAAACLEVGMRAGIQVALMEACADSAAFVVAREAIRRADFALVLDGVSHLTLGLARLASLQPDLVKLDWTPRMAALDAGSAARLDAALAEVGASRLLLARAHTEAAVRWGLLHGLRRFQGGHADAMLAASRLASCAHRADCTLRQCTERAASAAAAGRRFCRNLPLLDAGAPYAAGTPGSVSRARVAA